jgi:predicted small lipoprotein YifL
MIVTFERNIMRKAIVVPVLALAAFGLAGCGKKAPNEALEANESIGGDSNAMGEAVSDQDEAMNAAFSNSEQAYDAAPTGNATAPANPEEGSGDE